MSSLGQFGFEELGGHGAEGLAVGLNSGLRGDSACGGQGGGQGSSEWLPREDGGELSLECPDGLVSWFLSQVEIQNHVGPSVPKKPQKFCVS